MSSSSTGHRRNPRGGASGWRRHCGGEAMTRNFVLVLLLSAGVARAWQVPGAELLTGDDDLSAKMMDGAHRFVERKIAESPAARQRHWQRNFSSRAAYEKSVELNRTRFREKIGLVDPRLPAAMERFGDAPGVRVYQVRWPVLDGVDGEGLLLEPAKPAVARVVAIPDAGQTPEQIAGLAPGLAPEQQFARRLAEHGCLAVIPTLLDRTSRWSGYPEIRMTDQTHREWNYRQA